MVSVDTVRDAFGGFADQSDERIAWAIDQARPLAGANDDLWLWCAAHLLALRIEDTGEPDGGSGELAGETVGSLSATYTTQARNHHDVFYSRTHYGRMFLALCRPMKAGLFFNA